MIINTFFNIFFNINIFFKELFKEKQGCQIYALHELKKETSARPSILVLGSWNLACNLNFGYKFWKNSPFPIKRGFLGEWFLKKTVKNTKICLSRRQFLSYDKNKNTILFIFWFRIVVATLPLEKIVLTSLKISWKIYRKCCYFESPYIC